MNTLLRIHPRYTWLTLCLVTICLLLFPDVPLWSIGSAMIFFFWRLLVEIFEWPPPSRWMTGGLSVIFLVATLYTFQSWIGKEVSACFIVILTSLKILELKEEDEKNFLALLGLFLVASKFLFSLDLIYVFFGFPILFVCIMSLYPMEYLPENPRQKILQTLKIILITLPLTAFLYIFFPRFTQKFIEVQGLQDRVGLSGFSDSVQPGQISQLVQSDELVFRAELISRFITADTMYWRGQVLNEVSMAKNQELTWKKSLQEGAERPGELIDPDYRVILEPTGKRWLFFLDQTDALQSDSFRIFRTRNDIYQASDSITKRVSYYGQINRALKSPTRFELEFIDRQMKTFPYSDKVKQLAKTFIPAKATRAESAELILNYFKGNSFFYTLNPGTPALNLEDFLFKTKKGFCEHFAASAAHLFRAAGIPARVVVGYQGGLYNRSGQFWSITQKDAHAWIEYLNEDTKWVRLDPTAVVAPLRFELGAQAFFKLSEEDLKSASFDDLKKKLSQSGWLEETSNWFENVNYKWNSWLLDYDLEKQKQWLESFNISLPVLAVSALLACLLATLIVQFLTRSRKKKPDFELVQQALNQNLKRLQMQKKSTEGPFQWKNRLMASGLFNADDLQFIFDHYVMMAYGKDPAPLEKNQRRQLLRKIKSLQNLKN